MDYLCVVLLVRRSVLELLLHVQLLLCNTRPSPPPPWQTNRPVLLHPVTITYMNDSLRPMGFYIRCRCVFNNLWTLPRNKSSV